MTGWAFDLGALINRGGANDRTPLVGVIAIAKLLINLVLCLCRDDSAPEHRGTNGQSMYFIL